MDWFSKYENEDNTKYIMKDDDLVTKETNYDDGSKRYMQIKDYEDDKHDTRFATYDADTSKYVEGYHGENNDDDYKKILGDTTEEMRGRR
jgi:hypothetical protein